MPAPAITKFGGDIRLWRKNLDNSLSPVIPSAEDPTGNQPVEANAMVMSREEGDVTEIKSKRRGTRYDGVIYSDKAAGTTSMSLTLLEVPPIILARVLYGQAANEVEVVTGSVVDAALPVPTKDRPLQLPHFRLKSTPTPVVKQATVALVAGTDYDIDLRRGQIRIKKAGVTVGATDLTISYSYDAHTKVVIEAGGSPTETFYVTGDMQNRVTQDDGELVVFEFKASIDGEVDLLGSEPISPVLTGPLITPSTESSPYRFTILKAAA